jgi:hypothetical protein
VTRQGNDARPTVSIASGERTSRKATRIEASGSRGFTRKSKSTTVPQLSQAIISQ